MAGRNDAFSAGTGRTPAASNADIDAMRTRAATAASALRGSGESVPESEWGSRVATPRSTYTPKAAPEVAAGVGETYSPELVRIKNAANLYNDSVNKNRTGIVRAVQGGAGATFAGAKRPLADMIQQVSGAGGHIHHLQAHINLVSKMGLPDEAVGNVGMMQSQLDRAKAGVESARKMGTGPGRSREETKLARNHMHKAMKEIAGVATRAYAPILAHHPQAVVPDNVDVNSIHDDLAYAGAVATEPSMQRNVAGKTPKNFKFGGRDWDLTTPVGKLVKEKVIEAAGSNESGLEQSVAKAGAKSLEPTPRLSEAEMKKLDEEGLPRNTRSTSRDRVTDEMTVNASGATTSPTSPNRDSGSNTGVSGGDVSPAPITSSEQMKINARAVKAKKPPVNKEKTFSTAVGKDLSVKEGAGNDAAKSN